jgi:Uma2 family endonuclease
MRAGKVSYEEYLATSEENKWTEWIDGEIVPMTPVGRDHQKLGAFLLSLLRAYVDHKNLGEVLYEPFQMKTGPDLPGRAPDIMVVGTERLAHLKQNYLDGPADLVVEVVSPESATRDRVEKYREYQQGGVREYWLIDPTQKGAEFFTLGKDGAYHPNLPDENGIYRSTVIPELWLKPAWLWQDPLPLITDILREWKLL